jgi:amino acid transporter
MKMRDPNELILKKIYTSFLTLSISVIILSTIIAFFYNITYPPCPACADCVCPPPQKLNTLGTYIFMLILTAIFLTIGLIIYVIRRIIIKRPSARISEEIESRKYK